MIIDLSHPLHNGMPVYPGTEGPLLERPFTLKSHGYNEARLTMVTHTGTHMDAPAHMVADGKTLDQFKAEDFTGRALCIPFKQGMEPTIEELEKILAEKNPDFLLFRTGWSRFWGTVQYFSDFPVMSLSLAEWIGQQPIRGIGLDVISVDPVGATSFPNHFAILGNGKLIIENLAHLDSLPAGVFTLCCFPLPIVKADGSPVRAVALTMD